MYNEISLADFLTCHPPPPLKQGDSFSQALWDSLGFFDDIPNSLWANQKEVAINRRHHRFPNDVRREIESSRAWYQTNWDPDFSCPVEDMLGDNGDGHKWVCDPHRLERQSKERIARGKSGCLVYSIGSMGVFDFERDVKKVMPSCEVHVFDITNFTDRIPEGLDLHFHGWGLKASYELPADLQQGIWQQTNMNDATFKTIQETVKELGHEGRSIDIFKIDCEGCEWRSYKDWLMDDVDIRQIQVEVHGTPAVAPQFFQDIHDANFVMFHKEPNIQYSDGSCVEFSFLKMASSFFRAKNGTASNETVGSGSSPRVKVTA
jgi:hypothetical protein